MWDSYLPDNRPLVKAGPKVGNLTLMKCKLLILAAFLYAISAGAQTRKYLITTGLSATVTHNPGKPTVEVALPGVELITLDLTQPVTNTFQIKTTDFNFDGFRDFAFVGVNVAGGTQVYDIYLYHPADKTFEALDVPGGVCEAFGNVRLNAGEKTLRSSCRSGAKSSLDIYKWSGPFSLELVKSVDNSTEAQTEQAEDKADRKAEKADLRQEKREKIKEKKEEGEDD